MRIYLVRHGETIWNTEGRIQGWKNSNLTEKGIEDAKALGKYLRDVDFQCAFTSPFQRAIDTTKFILGDKNIVITSNDNFRELNLVHGKAEFSKMLRLSIQSSTITYGISQKHIFL